MRKTHVKVVLDLLVYADDDCDITRRLSEAAFEVNEEEDDGILEGMKIIDTTVEEVSVTDSR